MANLPDENSRRLHFIVRHPEYEQTIGYGYFLDHVLQQLNTRPPKSASELLENTTFLLQNKKDADYHPPEIAFQLAKDAHPFFACLPDSLKKRLNIHNEEFFMPTSTANNAPAFFGPAAAADYGTATADFIEFTRGIYDRRMKDKGFPKETLAWGWALATPIINETGKQYRGYYDTLAKNYGLGKSPQPDFYLAFDYPVPDSDEKLPLMRIGSLSRLEGEFKTRFKGETAAIEEVGKRFTAQNITLTFLHPNCNRDFLKKLTRCLDPLLQQFDAQPAYPIPPGTPLPDDKLAAMATTYWLLAQSTPVMRGGSGLANVVLEHLAHRARKQGYEAEIPYLREGVDLWASAATLPLEDTKQLQGFKSRFMEAYRNQLPDNPFFDTQVGDQEIEYYLNHALQGKEGGIGGLIQSKETSIPQKNNTARCPQPPL